MFSTRNYDYYHFGEICGDSITTANSYPIGEYMLPVLENMIAVERFIYPKGETQK